MESWFGGGILFAVAAVLWLAYLVPNWLQRREYLASERNAVRLQQTIRVLAETAEAPEALHLESAAKARIAASKLRKQQVLAEARAAVDRRATAARRLRRTRLAITLVLVVALAVLGWQAWLAASGAAASGVVALLAALGAVAAGVMHVGVTKSARERSARAVVAATAAPRPSAARVPVTAPREAARTTSREWTPRPLPQPLGRLRRDAMLAAARAEALGQTRGAAEENARIAAAEVAAVTPVATTRIPAEAVANPMVESRFAAMGRVEDLVGSGAIIDLDSAIARRRVS